MVSLEWSTFLQVNASLICNSE